MGLIGTADIVLERYITLKKWVAGVSLGLGVGGVVQDRASATGGWALSMRFLWEGEVLFLVGLMGFGVAH